VELVREPASAGVPPALLPDAPVSLARTAEEQPWTRHFRHLVFSDRPENVDGANAAGLVGVLWQGPAHARQVLRS
jgi:putative hydrolase of the HAD superfamily